MEIKAAGILFRTKDNQVLFLKRGSGSFEGLWDMPGGKIEDGETPEQAAKREAREETGFAIPKGLPPLQFLCRSIDKFAEPAVPPSSAAVETAGGLSPLPTAVSPVEVDYTTYLQEVPEAFEINSELDNEHVGFAWAPANSPPQPIHPGCDTSLQVLAGNELDIARLMSVNKVTSPHRYKNVSLFKLRVTGTGLAYRNAKRDEKGKLIREAEHVIRNPEVYLNPEFLARCAGVPVIFFHPGKSMLNSDEFRERVIGAIMFAFIEGDEVWCIARIYDDDAISIMTDNQMSTSPGVILGPKKENPKIKLDNGKVVLIEGGDPSLLDHLAVCKLGVWDKGGQPQGVVVNDSEEELVCDSTEDQAMPEEKEKEHEEKKDRKDDHSEKLDKIMDAVCSMKDDFSKRMDRMDARMDSIETEKKKEEKKIDKKDAKADDDDDDKKDSKKKDAGDVGEGEEEGKAKKMAADKKDAKKDDKEEEEEVKDKKKKDDDDDDDDDKKDARTDSVSKADLDAIKAMIPVSLSDKDYGVLIEEQAKADDVYSAHGNQAPRPLNGESPAAYRRRAAMGLQKHSQRWKGVDLTKIGATEALNIAVDQIYADAAVAANAPIDVPDGMIAVQRRDRNTGHLVTTFRGKHSFVREFTPPSRAVTAFNTDRGGKQVN